GAPQSWCVGDRTVVLAFGCGRRVPSCASSPCGLRRARVTPASALAWALRRRDARLRATQGGRGAGHQGRVDSRRVGVWDAETTLYANLFFGARPHRVGAFMSEI